MRRLLPFLVLGLHCWSAGAAAGPRLQLEAKIPLGDVKGRIDHLALDLDRKRLFVAELGNGSVSVVDLEGRRVVQRLSGLEEPQGVAWSSASGTLYVASGGDGTLRAFAGEPLKDGLLVHLRGDADNVRIDAEHQVLVGFGSGGIAVLDGSTLSKKTVIEFPGHPESFQIEAQGKRVFVNDPDARQIVVLDRATAKVIDRWRLDFGANFPMALDEDRSRLLVLFRSPALLGIYSTKDGSSITRVSACGDADDVFLDPRRAVAYVICGSGSVDTFDTNAEKLSKVDTFATASGARTGFFSAQLDRLFVAVRASGSEPAAVWVLRPVE